MRFYLTGHRSFSNRGCEAIVRGTLAILRASYGSVTVLVPSQNIDADREQWPEAAEHGVEFVPAYTTRLARYWVPFQQLPIASLKRAGWPFPYPSWLVDQIRSVDAVLSVGGDNYSLDYRLPTFLQGLDALAMKLGKPVVVWGASVGPFERDPRYLPVIRNHLGRMRKVLVRESISDAYLRDELGLGNVARTADPAFMLEPGEVDCEPFWPRDSGNGVLGLNISPLIARYAASGQDLVAEVVSFIRSAVEKRGLGVLLVPHVVPYEGVAKNSDAHFMAGIFAGCRDLAPAVSNAPPTLNAAQLKHLIGRVRYFFGARTHATIAAMSSLVPTVSIAYSVKARGINRDIFGDDDIVLPTPEVSSASLARKLDLLEQNEESLRRTLADAVPRLRRLAAAAPELYDL